LDELMAKKALSPMATDVFPEKPSGEELSSTSLARAEAAMAFEEAAVLVRCLPKISTDDFERAFAVNEGEP
jgi:hypothetical protein